MEVAERVRSIRDVIEAVKRLDTMSHIDARDYAVEDGWANVVAEKIEKGMKFTQLRKFFDSVKRIKKGLRSYDEDEEIDSIDGIGQERYELIPELAYALGRSLITREFYDLMKICLQDKIHSVKDFRAFEKFLSAILAYCKMCGKSSESS